MNQKSAKDFDPEVLKLFDEYVHGFIDRRDFLKSAGRFAVGAVTAEGLLQALQPRFAQAQQVAGNDPRLSARYIEVPSPDGYGTLRGYLAQPATTKDRLPCVLVAHENRGLNPHIEDIARRLALDNFIAFAPDALFPLGGYPGDEDKARDLWAKLDQAKVRADFLRAAKYLEHLPNGNGRVGAVGFCWGGGTVNYLATRMPQLGAAVPFYGSAPPADEVARIKAALLIHYAEKDERLTAGWPAFEESLKAAGVRYQTYIYPGTEHGFNNDTTPRYDKKAAKLAWKRTIDFFNARLRT
jgi:carboxymethylenebutenolidase